MRLISRSAAVLGTLLFCLNSVYANSIAHKTNSSYGESADPPLVYTSGTDLDSLTGGTLFVNTLPPTGFNEEVLCPFSLGCAPGGSGYALLLQSVGTLTPGSEISIDLGPDAVFADVSILTCDPTNVSGTYCMMTPPGSACAYSYPQAPPGEFVTIQLPNSSSCVPAGLVFSIDEDVLANGEPTFGTVTTSSIPAPEPGSLILLSLGILSILGLYTWDFRKRNIQRTSPV
jgi:hypothetical protein